jgi:peroxiredoxin Q/BCP
VFVVDKEGKVLAAESGGPAATVEVVRKLVGDKGEVEQDEKKEDEVMAETADEVADSAAKVDA